MIHSKASSQVYLLMFRELTKRQGRDKMPFMHDVPGKKMSYSIDSHIIHMHMPKPYVLPTKTVKG